MQSSRDCRPVFHRSSVVLLLDFELCQAIGIGKRGHDLVRLFEMFCRNLTNRKFQRSFIVSIYMPYLCLCI